MLKTFFSHILKLKIIQLAAVLSALTLIFGCSQVKEEIINIGYIGPLSKRATDLGIAPANALTLAVEQYNLKKKLGQPLIKLFVEDDEWESANAITAYNKLKIEHQIKVLFISNSGGMIALQDQAIQDHIIMVNPTNSDAVLSSLNHNSFKIAKSTE
jgi:ABC-type branched-subunit amino acid transport system substrate-binding protein